jgi:hypothetical protein
MKNAMVSMAGCCYLVGDGVIPGSMVAPDVATASGTAVPWPTGTSLVGTPVGADLTSVGVAEPLSQPAAKIGATTAKANALNKVIFRLRINGCSFQL